MKGTHILIATALAVLLPGCLIKPSPPSVAGDAGGGSRPDAGMIGGTADATPTPPDARMAMVDAAPQPTGGDYYVNGTSGSDSNPGTEAMPFATITHALGVAGSGDTVHVEADIYHPQKLEVPKGVTLTAVQGQGRVIIVASQPGDNVLLGAGAIISNFHIFITASQGRAISLGFGSNGAEIKNNVINAGMSSNPSAIGIQIRRGDRQIIAGNEIHGCLDGLDFEGGGTNASVAGNVISNNAIGVNVAQSAGDLGGGSTMSAGGNVLSCNHDADLRVSTRTTVHAENDAWDHVPPSAFCNNSGADICDNGGNAVDTLGATLAPNPCP